MTKTGHSKKKEDNFKALLSCSELKLFQTFEILMDYPLKIRILQEYQKNQSGHFKRQ